MQTTAGGAILPEQVTAMDGQANFNHGAFLDQCDVVVAIDQILLNSGHLHVDLSFIAQLLDHADFAAQAIFGFVAGQQMFRTNTE